MCPISSVVVVLPLVPVTAMNSLGNIRHASSSSPMTGSPRERAAAITGACAGTPGLLTTQRTRPSRDSPWGPACTCTPASSSASVPPGTPASTPITSAPLARSASAAATPERASPTTRYGPAGISGRGFNWTRRRSADALAVDREADRAADRRDDPEAQDDLRLRPCPQLEMMVDGRHQEDPFARQLEVDDLDHDRQRLDHEDPAEQDQEQLGLCHDRHARDRAAQPQRAGVPHEDRGGEGVEPEKADAPADQAAGEHRQVVLPRDERDTDVGQQDDCR